MELLIQEFNVNLTACFHCPSDFSYNKSTFVSNNTYGRIEMSLHIYGVFTLSDTKNDICNETDVVKSSQWHQWQGLRPVWSVLHITAEPLIIVVSLGIIFGVVQCEQTISWRKRMSFERGSIPIYNVKCTILLLISPVFMVLLDTLDTMEELTEYSAHMCWWVKVDKILCITSASVSSDSGWSLVSIPKRYSIVVRVTCNDRES